jgi:hypothetical protein
MVKATFGFFSFAAVVLLAASFSNVSAETKAPKAPKPPACSTLKDEFACRGRDDCQWNAAVLDTKTGKEKRKAACGPKPAAKKK